MSITMPPAGKVKQFPTTPGVYLMKDDKGVVHYVGKATDAQRAVAMTHLAKHVASKKRFVFNQ
jgi:excinuclease ABC subunit C